MYKYIKYIIFKDIKLCGQKRAFASLSKNVGIGSSPVTLRVQRD